MHFKAQIIYGPIKNGFPCNGNIKLSPKLLEHFHVVGVEFFVRGVKPEANNDLLIVQKILDFITAHRNTFIKIPPHVNVYCCSLQYLHLLSIPSGIPIVFEILEEDVRLEEFVEPAFKLKKLYPNIKFAMDDFGAGRSNFFLFSKASQLFDIIKVDTEAVPEEVLPAIINLCKKHDKYVYVEKIHYVSCDIITCIDGIQSFSLHKPEKPELIISKISECRESLL